MERTLAHLACETLDDVFTPEGDAVVIGKLDGVWAQVSGEHHHERWFPIADLSPSEGLLANARAEGRK